MAPSKDQIAAILPQSPADLAAHDGHQLGLLSGGNGWGVECKACDNQVLIFYRDPEFYWMQLTLPRKLVKQAYDLMLQGMSSVVEDDPDALDILRRQLAFHLLESSGSWKQCDVCFMPFSISAAPDEFCAYHNTCARHHDGPTIHAIDPDAIAAKILNAIAQSKAEKAAQAIPFTVLPVICELCGAAFDSSSMGAESDWNPSTNCHLSCESKEQALGMDEEEEIADYGDLDEWADVDEDEEEYQVVSVANSEEDW